MRPILAVLAVIVVSGCTQISLVQPSRQTVAGAYSVVPSVAWNKVAGPGVRTIGNEVWTRDGLGLQSMNFFATADGQRPFRHTSGESKKDENMPVFRKTMTILDLKDLVEGSMAQLDAIDFATVNIKPAKIADVEGFRVDFTYTAKSGIKRKGFVAGAVVNDQLLMVMYEAAALYYFERDRTEAERIVNSVQIVKKAELVHSR